MGRLIDVDDVKKLLVARYENAELITKDIDKISTAYDVDKVVEELEKLANLQDRVALSISDYAERYCHIKTADAYRQAILIAKGAVKDE